MSYFLIFWKQNPRGVIYFFLKSFNLLGMWWLLDINQMLLHSVILKSLVQSYYVLSSLD